MHVDIEEMLDHNHFSQDCVHLISPSYQFLLHNFWIRIYLIQNFMFLCSYVKYLINKCYVILPDSTVLMAVGTDVIKMKARFDACWGQNSVKLCELH